MSDDIEVKEQKDIDTAEQSTQSIEEPLLDKPNKSEIKLSGLIGTKVGMTQTIADDGKVIPTTVIKLGPCLALEKKLKKDKTSLKIGYQEAKPRLLTKSKLGYLSKLKVKPIKYVKEFDLLNPEVEITPGEEIKADIFKECDISINTALGRMRYALINLRKLQEKHQVNLTIQ